MAAVSILPGYCRSAPAIVAAALRNEPVLQIACANVANLLQVRVAAREIAGVVAEIKYTSRGNDQEAGLYVPHAQKKRDSDDGRAHHCRPSPADGGDGKDCPMDVCERQAMDPGGARRLLHPGATRDEGRLDDCVEVRMKLEDWELP